MFEALPVDGGTGAVPLWAEKNHGSQNAEVFPNVWLQVFPQGYHPFQFKQKNLAIIGWNSETWWTFLLKKNLE